MGQLPVWAQQRGGTLLLRVHVQPGARRSAFAGVHGERLKISLQAPPVDGKANELLLRFLAGALELPRSALELSSGASSREKTVSVATGESAAVELVERLRRLAGIADERSNETAAHKARPVR